MIKIGDIFEEEFSFSQQDVNAFANISGDHNPIHIDPEYTANTVYKKPIIHGFLGGSIFSKILGTSFPGEGTVYLNQTISFKRPMYPEVKYKAVLTVKEIDNEKHRAIIDTKIIESESGKPNITGEASVMNKIKI
jgi:acyl dehydratase